MGLCKKLLKGFVNSITLSPELSDAEMTEAARKYGSPHKRCMNCNYHVCAVDGSCPSIDSR